MKTKKTVLCFILAVALILPNTVFAAEAATPSTGAYGLLEEFVTDNPSRTAGTAGEGAAADWIENKLKEFGYTDGDISRQTFSIENYLSGVSGSGLTTTSENISLSIPSAVSNGKVVIGAHYDNASSLYNGYSATGGQGVSDNGGGVAVLLELARRFKDVSLDFDLEIVFFGAEELGLVGSRHYVSGLTQSVKDDILLMINIDVVVNGDYLYVWGEDGYTPQAAYFAEVSGGSARVLPANKRAVYGVSVTGSRPYYTVAHAADSMSFLDAGIPVAFFFSGNLSLGSFGYVENDGMDGVMHTENDTLEYISERYRDKMISNTDAVVNTIYNGVTADGFVAAVENARDYITGGFWLNGVYAMAITLVIMAGLGVWAYFYYGKLKKRAILGTADVRGERVFTRPDDDDIFTFRS